MPKEKFLRIYPIDRDDHFGLEINEDVYNAATKITLGLLQSCLTLFRLEPSGELKRGTDYVLKDIMGVKKDEPKMKSQNLSADKLQLRDQVGVLNCFIMIDLFCLQKHKHHCKGEMFVRYILIYWT